MTYNLTGISANGTTTLGFVQGVNNVLMFGWLGVMFLITIVVITFMSFIYSTNDVKKSVSASSFIAFGLAILLRAINLIPDLALFITLIGAAISLAFTWKD